MVEVEGLKDGVHEWWNSVQVIGDPGHVLAEKLKMLKIKIQGVEQRQHGKLETNERAYCQFDLNLESVQEQSSLAVDELLQKIHFGTEFEEVAKKEELAWKQRSRVQWLKQQTRAQILPQYHNISQEIQFHGTIGG